jgi:hypothetical protein
MNPSEEKNTQEEWEKKRMKSEGKELKRRKKRRLSSGL